MRPSELKSHAPDATLDFCPENTVNVRTQGCEKSSEKELTLEERAQHLRCVVCRSCSTSQLQPPQLNMNDIPGCCTERCSRDQLSDTNPRKRHHASRRTGRSTVLASLRLPPLCATIPALHLAPPAEKVPAQVDRGTVWREFEGRGWSPWRRPTSCILAMVRRVGGARVRSCGRARE